MFDIEPYTGGGSSEKMYRTFLKLSYNDRYISEKKSLYGSTSLNPLVISELEAFSRLQKKIKIYSSEPGPIKDTPWQLLLDDLKELKGLEV